MQKSRQRKPKVVVIGGGTGGFTVLSGLRKYPLELSAVVTMADDGGSTGVLREEFGILPPGDVRRVLVALAHSDNRILSDLFNYRFAEGGLKGHAFGNIMLTALERITGGFEEAIEEAGKILGIQGTVLPVTFDQVRLSAKLADGKIIKGEDNIYDPKHDRTIPIKQVYLDREAKANKKAVEAILNADLVVLGPGDFYASIVPNLLINGIPQTIRKSRAKKVFVVNLTSKRGATNGFSVPDFIYTMEHYLGKSVLDYAIVNTKRPSENRLKRYEQEEAEFVSLPKDHGLKKPLLIAGDFLRRQGFVRHDPDRLAKVLISLL